MQLAIPYNRPNFVYGHPTQLKIINDKTRFVFVEAGTKAGKTTAMLIWIWEQAIAMPENRNAWWVAAFSDQAIIAYNRLWNQFIPPEIRPRFEKNDTKHIITLPGNRRIFFKSADKPDTLYGDDVYAMVIDEASRVKQNSWEACLSVITATKGPLRAIGNVKGKKNWFYGECRRAEAGLGRQNAYYKMLSTDNPGIDAGMIEFAQEKLSDQVFNELYNAEPDTEEGNPFGMSCIAGAVVPKLSGLPAEYFGIDVGVVKDYTVIIGLDRNGHVSHFERFKGSELLDREKQIGSVTQKIKSAIGTRHAIIDGSGKYKTIALQLKKTNRLLQLFTFVSKIKGGISKENLIDLLALGMEEGTIKIPHSESSVQAFNIIREELEDLDYEITQTGIVRYVHSTGRHDDCVMALAMANLCMRRARRMQS